MHNEVTSKWSNWKDFLGEAVEFAEEIGISRKQIADLALQAGNILASEVEPASPEQQVLKELWLSADDSEKQALASLMTKLSLSETK